MRPAEFEEKEYEFHLYDQLAAGNRNVWPPGQVLEGYLGFDCGLFVEDPYIWRLMGRGIRRGLVPWFSMWRFIPRDARHRLPRFRVNCFIQAKRPEVGARITKRLRDLGNKQPVYRFSIDSDQQLVLEAAAEKLRGRALFAYAAAVFSTSRDLFRHATDGSMADNSTFPEVKALSSQHAWYYNEPGATGVVNRSFERRRMPSLQERLEALIGEHVNRTEEQQSPSDALSELFRSIHDVFEREGIAGQARSAGLASEWRRIAIWTREFDMPPALASFLSISAFATYFNLSWLTIA